MLILEDRTEVKNEQEAGKLSVVTGMGEKAKLKTILPEREDPKVKAELEKSQVRFEDFLPMQKKTTAIPENKVDWKQLETIGVTKERLEESGQLEKLLNWQKSDLVTIAVKAGNETIYTGARLAHRTSEDGAIDPSIHNISFNTPFTFFFVGI